MSKMFHTYIIIASLVCYCSDALKAKGAVKDGSVSYPIDIEKPSELQGRSIDSSLRSNLSRSEEITQWYCRERCECQTNEDLDWAPLIGPCIPGAGTGTWSNRLLVWPEKKIAFCQIEKNACTEFTRLFNVLNGLEDDRSSTEWFASSIEAHPNLKIDDISKANGWQLGMFIREPAERFLSAWKSKCEVWEDDGFNCLGRQRAEAGTEAAVEQFENMVTDVLPRYMSARQEQGHFNAHYDPQSSFCGGRPVDDYAFLGYLSDNHTDVNAQVRSMVSSAGVPMTQDLHNTIDMLFPASAIAGHSSHSTSAVNEFYRNPKVLELVKSAYKQDYDVMGEVHQRRASTIGTQS